AIELSQQRAVLKVPRANRLLDVFGCSSANQHRVDLRLMQCPGERQLGRASSAARTDALEPCEPTRREFVEVDVLVRRNEIETRSRLHAGAMLAGEKAGAEGAVADALNAVRAA